MQVIKILDARLNISQFGVSVYTHTQLFPFVSINLPIHATVN